MQPDHGSTQGPIVRVVTPWRTAQAAERERGAEAQELCRLILDRLDPPNDAQAAFLQARFGRRLEWFGARGRLIVSLHTLLALVIVAAGLLTSGITALEDQQLTAWSYVVIGLGVLVGVFTGLMQIWRPSERSVSYLTAERQLRDEGWRFVQRRGRYEHCESSAEAWDAFVDAVQEIEGHATTVDRTPLAEPQR